MNLHEKRILITTCYGHFLTHFNMLVFPALVLPLVATLNISLAEVLKISLWMYILFGVSALPWGVIGDKIGARCLIPLMYIGSAVCSLIAAVSIHSQTTLTFALAGIGLFSGIYHPVGLGLISRKIKRLSMAMGYNGIFGNVGLAGAPIITGLFNYFWGPSSAYFLLSIMNLIGIIFLIIFPIPDQSILETEETTHKNNQYLLPFIILLCSMTLEGLIYRSTTVIMPTYFELKLPIFFNFITNFFHVGFSKNLIATSLISVIYLIGVLGQYTSAKLAEKIDLKTCYLIFNFIPMIAAIFIGMTANLSLIFFTILFFFFLLGLQPIENTLVAKFIPAKLRSSAYGIKFVLAFGVGAMGVQMVGLIQLAFHLEAIFYFLAGVSFIIISLIFLLKKIKPGYSDYN